MHYNIFRREPGSRLFKEPQNGIEVEIDTATETGVDAIRKYLGDNVPKAGTQYMAIPFSGKYGQRLVTTVTVQHKVVADLVEDVAPKEEE